MHVLAHACQPACAYACASAYRFHAVALCGGHASLGEFDRSDAFCVRGGPCATPVGGGVAQQSARVALALIPVGQRSLRQPPGRSQDAR